jgi:hypothetical protein
MGKIAGANGIIDFAQKGFVTCIAPVGGCQCHYGLLKTITASLAMLAIRCQCEGAA